MVTTIKKLIISHQQTMVLSVCFGLVFAVGFGIGSVVSKSKLPPEVRIEQVFAAPLNDSQNPAPLQSEQSTSKPAGEKADCQGKIRGNISSDGSKIYHIPGGSFYDRVIPEMCFATETEAQAQGFRKSSK